MGEQSHLWFLPSRSTFTDMSLFVLSATLSRGGVSAAGARPRLQIECGACRHVLGGFDSRPSPPTKAAKKSPGLLPLYQSATGAKKTQPNSHSGRASLLKHSTKPLWQWKAFGRESLRISHSNCVISLRPPAKTLRSLNSGPGWLKRNTDNFYLCGIIWLE